MALERAGRTLNRVAGVFYNLTGAHTSEELQAVEREIAPQLAAHETAVMLNPKIFARVEDLYKRRDRLRLTDEQRRVLELHHTWLVRAGAKLGRKAKARVAEINERLATLATQFAQNVLKDEQSWRLVLDGERDLAGLPSTVRAAAARAAADAGLKGKHVITLSRSSVEPFLQFSARRDLREQAFNAWTKRGEMGGTTDNRAITAEIVALRAELAKLLGYDSYADYSLDDAMAKTPAAVRDLLTAVWPAAVRARRAGARSPAGARARRGRQLRDRGVGLALLLREGAQGALRFGRGGDAALLHAGDGDRRGVRHRRGACSACASRSSPTFPAITRTCASGR